MSNMSTTRTIISVEGNIGSGKSTLLANLETALKGSSTIVFLQEPVDEWSTITDSLGKTMLEKFYENQEAYSFSFQMMAYISRLAALKKAVQEHPEATVFITERSLDTDKYVFAQMLFDDNKMEDVHFQIYRKWFDVFAREFPITKRIYVETNPEICYDRIAKRSRNGESTISLDYLQNCHNYHKIMMNQSDATLLELNGNVDIFEKRDVLEEWIQTIISFATCDNKQV
jgi:deoxyadenosine/deoxycytidine kinase